MGVWPCGSAASSASPWREAPSSMVSSASYIAAPAAVRIALPEANPTFYLTASLGITFPFNVTLGIPLYYAVAGWLLL